MSDAEVKYEKLLEYFKNLGGVVIAFSGGVDSTFLLKSAKEASGVYVIAVTAKAAAVPEREVREAVAFCKEEEIAHIIVEVDQLAVEGFAENPPNKCYLCKTAIMKAIKEEARKNGFQYVAEASNMDDLGDYRPGLQAVKEQGIFSPLQEIGFTKAEIREMSKLLGLRTADKPSFACLASRFPYGEEITEEKLKMVEEAEDFLFQKGFAQFRVRIHGTIARIELPPEDFPKILEENLQKEVYDEFQKLGFSYVALDLKGYRTGSMNEALPSSTR